MHQMLSKTRLSLLFSFIVLIVCTGCPYESKYPLSGTLIKYDSRIIGNWDLGMTDLNIKRVDDYTFKFDYNDHDSDLGIGKVTGTGYVVLNNGNSFIIAETEEKKYVTYKLVSISQRNLSVIALDEDKVGEGKTFSSAASFTNFVTSNSSLFSSSNAEVYTREGSTASNNNTDYSKILFQDNFENNKNNWYTNYDFKDSNYIYIKTASEPREKLYFANRSGIGSYSITVPYTLPSNYNYSIEIEAQHSKDVYNKTDHPFGIVFAASDWDNSYALHIAETGYYRLSKTQNKQYSVIVPWTKTSTLIPNYSFNKLEIKVYTSHAEIFINDQYVNKISNFVPFGPKTRLQVFNKQTIHFDNLVIKRL